MPAQNVNLAIPAADYPDVQALAAQIEEEVKRISSKSSEKTSIVELPQSVEVIPPAIMRTIANVANNVWKLRQKMTQAGSGDVKEEFKRLYRHVASIVESFEEIGVEIKDRTGETFDYGLPEKVIASQPQSGISKSFVIETVKPTIYFSGQILQCGEVVIATPEETSPPQNAPS